MAKARHGEIRAAMRSALETGRAPASVYEPWVIARNESPASSNKGVMANVAALIAEPRRYDGPVLGWSEWWVEQPLHEREALSPSGSYRPDMDLAALALAGIALDRGRPDLAARLLARAQAGVGYLILGIGPAPPRAVRDQGTPGKAMIVLGDGRLEPLPGAPKAPYIVQAGKRGHVRADLRDTGDADGVEGSAFAGSWSYTRGWELTAMVLQALGLAYKGAAVEWEHAVYEAIARRWPDLRGWGLPAAERAAGRRLLDNPADADAARVIVGTVSRAPTPALPFELVAYADGSKFALALELDESSTGGRAISAQYARGGVTVAASADTGGRARDDIRRQRVIELPASFECFWIDAPYKRLRVRKPERTAEAWRASALPLEGVRFSVGGRPPEDDDSTGELPLPPDGGPPAPPEQRRTQTIRVRPLSVQECREQSAPDGTWIVSSSSPTATIRETHRETSTGELKRWLVIP